MIPRITPLSRGDSFAQDQIIDAPLTEQEVIRVELRDDSYSANTFAEPIIGVRALPKPHPTHCASRGSRFKTATHTDADLAACMPI